MAKKNAEDRLKDLDYVLAEKAKERDKLIDELATKKAQELRLKEKQDNIKAEKNRLQERKTDTARKILLGAFLAKSLRDEGERGTVHSWLGKDLPGFLKTKRERDLFPEFQPKTD